MTNARCAGLYASPTQYAIHRPSGDQLSKPSPCFGGATARGLRTACAVAVLVAVPLVTARVGGGLVVLEIGIWVGGIVGTALEAVKSVVGEGRDDREAGVQAA